MGMVTSVARSVPNGSSSEDGAPQRGSSDVWAGPPCSRGLSERRKRGVLPQAGEPARLTTRRLLTRLFSLWVQESSAGHLSMSYY